MLIDLRYHIITVVIIFITLGIGILIGSTMVGNDLIIEQQQSLINNLEQNLTDLRNKNTTFKTRIQELEAKLATNLEFQETILPLVVQEQLAEQRLLLLLGDNINPNLRQKVEKILELADIDQLKIISDRRELNQEFQKILLLGQVEESLVEKLEQNQQIIQVDKEELQSSSDLIKLVFQLTPQDLNQVRSVDFE
ncbi:copper transporter [Halanaerobaculum tunisiense]